MLGRRVRLSHQSAHRNFFKEILKNPLTNSQIYDTMCIQGKGNQTEVKKKDLKKSKKVLDKPHKVWYNKDTKRTGTSGNRKNGW